MRAGAHDGAGRQAAARSVPGSYALVEVSITTAYRR
jgi:hypothetical protein